MLIEKLGGAYATIAPLESIETVIKRIADSASWSVANELLRLREASSDQFYETFKQLKDGAAEKGIEVILSIAQHDARVNQYMGTIENVVKALSRIASENPLNALRMKRFGIDPKGTPPN